MESDHVTNRYLQYLKCYTILVIRVEFWVWLLRKYLTLRMEYLQPPDCQCFSGRPAPSSEQTYIIQGRQCVCVCVCVCVCACLLVCVYVCYAHPHFCKGFFLLSHSEACASKVTPKPGKKLILDQFNCIYINWLIRNFPTSIHGFNSMLKLLY
jgi:hypothetical protein